MPVAAQAGDSAVRPPPPARPASPLPDALAFLVLAGLLAWLALRGAAHMDYSWQWARVWPYVIKPVGAGEYVAKEGDRIAFAYTSL